MQPPRSILALIVALTAQIAFAGDHGGSHSSSGTVHVNGYYRKDGTYVHSYDRAAPGTASVGPNSGTSTINRSSPYVPTTSTSSVPTATAVVPVAPDLRSEKQRVQDAIAAGRIVLKKDQRAKAPKPTDLPTSISQPQASSGVVARDANGKIKRSESAKHEFMRMTGYPNGRPGYVVDHIIPLKRGGCDCPSNMQWQTIQDAKVKDKWE